MCCCFFAGFIFSVEERWGICEGLAHRRLSLVCVVLWDMTDLRWSCKVCGFPFEGEGIFEDEGGNGW